MTELKYPLFDGERLWDGATVTVEDGRILSVTACDPAECDEGLLIPGLIDAHTHMGTRAHIEAMLKAGITAICDVSASAELAEHSDKLEIIRSAGMAMGVVMNPKGIIAFSPLSQGLLTDRYLKGIPADSRIMTDGRFLKENALTPERLEQIRQLNDLAAQRGQSLAQMALSWILRDGIVTSVLAGASRPEQVLNNIKAAQNTTFTADELALIDKISL